MPATAQIGPEDSLQETIWYTRDYVVEHTTEHFRYDYYRNALSRALRLLQFDPCCPPGPSSGHRLRVGSVLLGHVRLHGGAGHVRSPSRWTTTDTITARPWLSWAHLFLERFPDRYEFHGFSELARS